MKLTCTFLFACLPLIFGGILKENNFEQGCAPMPSLKKNGTGAGQRVMGGQPQKLPYQIQITREGFFGEIGHQCGAVLVSPKFVLTAKHCIFEPYSDRIINQNEFALLAGGFISKDPNAQKRRIARYIPINRSSDDFIEPTIEDPYSPDIVMFEVDTPFDINEKVIPACLPNRPAPIRSNCVVSGWGYSPNSSDKLLAAKVSVTSSNYCGRRGKLPDHELCAYDRKRDVCRGDSGGPLVCSTEGGATLHGIVAGGLPCWVNASERYGVYTDIFHFKEAIEDQITRQNDHTCPLNRIGYQDGQCDSRLNNAENCFDGGDCCGTDSQIGDCLEECEYYGQDPCNCDCKA